MTRCHVLSKHLCLFALQNVVPVLVIHLEVSQWHFWSFHSEHHCNGSGESRVMSNVATHMAASWTVGALDEFS